MGVFLLCATSTRPSACLPHARGGVSHVDVVSLLIRRSSPRPWGCFQPTRSGRIFPCVFPTPVGVFLLHVALRTPAHSLPHARGGVSKVIMDEGALPESSPRPWGCFYRRKPQQTAYTVFPTPVGVFPMTTATTLRCSSLPHARGGVSDHQGSRGLNKRSSPRPWGCFYRRKPQQTAYTVFPTPVGVFLEIMTAPPASLSLPHARGGVSPISRKAFAAMRSSPRPWGCFYRSSSSMFCRSVFPTPVGVFLAA